MLFLVCKWTMMLPSKTSVGIETSKWRKTKEINWKRSIFVVTEPFQFKSEDKFAASSLTHDICSSQWTTNFFPFFSFCFFFLFFASSFIYLLQLKSNAKDVRKRCDFIVCTLSGTYYFNKWKLRSSASTYVQITI